MTFDICPICDGSGFRNVFDGSMCYACNGLGVIEDTDPDDEYDEYVFDEDQKRNDAIERGDELRDRAKDERGC